jgi:4-amino-4-deoxychorismate lyase
MCRFIESIRIENGSIVAQSWHEERMNETRRSILHLHAPLRLTGILPVTIPKGIAKCRITYSDIIHSVEIIPYKPKIVNTLQLIEDNEIDYAYKYADRSRLDNLLSRKTADEIIIVRQGLITDTSYSNLIFYDGKRWHTPSSFLLNGTRRQRMLLAGLIVESEIRPSDLRHFTRVKLINAMLDPETSPSILLKDSELI